VGCEALEELADASPCMLDGAFLGFAQEPLQLGEDLLDRVEVRRVRRQQEELGAGGAYGGADGPAFVAVQIVHNDDVARVEGRHQELAHVDQEACAVDRTVEDAGSGDAVMSKGCQEGQRLPVTMRHFGRQRRAAPVPAMGSGHVGLGPGLVDEDQPPRIDPALVFVPPGPLPGNVRAILLAGEHGFF